MAEAGLTCDDPIVRGGIIAGLIAAGALTASSCSASGNDNPLADVAVVDGVSEQRSTSDTPSLDPGATINEAAARVLRQERRLVDPAPLGDIQDRFGIAPVVLPAGPLTTRNLGIEMTLHLDDRWRLEWGAPSQVVLADVDGPLGALRPNIVFFRPVGLFDPLVVPYGHGIPGETPWPADDLEGWLEEVPQIAVAQQGEFAIGDRAARWFDVFIDASAGPVPTGCDPGDCVAFAFSGTHHSFVLRDKESVRWYVIDDPAGPIFVLLAVDTGNADFFERGDAVIRGIDLGPSEPHPIPPGAVHAPFTAISAGPTRFTGLGGFEWRPEAPSYVSQRGGMAVLDDSVTGITVTRPEQAADGSVVETVDDLIEAIADDPQYEVTVDTATSVELAEGASTSAIVLSITGPQLEPDEPPLRLVAIDADEEPRFVAWPRRAYTKSWVIEHDGDFHLVSVEADSQDQVDRASSRIAEVIRQLSFFSE